MIIATICKLQNLVLHKVVKYYVSLQPSCSINYAGNHPFSIHFIRFIKNNKLSHLIVFLDIHIYGTLHSILFHSLYFASNP